MEAGFFGARDVLLNSIALAQMYWMSLAQFFRYPFDDSTRCTMQRSEN